MFVACRQLLFFSEKFLRPDDGSVPPLVHKVDWLLLEFS